MAEREQQIMLKMGEAVSQISEEKKMFLLGYVEGIAAMADHTEPPPAPDGAN